MYGHPKPPVMAFISLRLVQALLQSREWPAACCVSSIGGGWLGVRSRYAPR